MWMESARWAFVMDIGWTSCEKSFTRKTTFELSLCQGIVGVRESERVIGRQILLNYIVACSIFDFTIYVMRTDLVSDMAEPLESVRHITGF